MSLQRKYSKNNLSCVHSVLALWRWMEYVDCILRYHRSKFWAHHCKFVQTTRIWSVDKEEMDCYRVHFKYSVDRGPQVSLSAFKLQCFVAACCHQHAVSHQDTVVKTLQWLIVANGAVNGAVLWIPVFTRTARFMISKRLIKKIIKIRIRSLS